MANILEEIRGKSAATIRRIDEPPLTGKTTFLVAATKALGFLWFPIGSITHPGLHSPFVDTTEEVPKEADPCDGCGGSGEELSEDGKTSYQCSKCAGYGVKNEGQGYTIRRSICWQFLADHSVEVEGKKLSPGEFWRLLQDEPWCASNSKSIISILAKAWNVGEEMKPSARIRLIEEEILRPLFAGPVRNILEEAIFVYRGLCWKLQAKEDHPKFGPPLYRHILVRQGRDKAYIRYDWSEERKLAKLKDYGMA